MKELLTAIGSYVGAAGYGSMTGEDANIKLGEMPELPYACLGIFLTGGSVVAGDPLEHKSIQIVYRNPNPETAMTVANSIHSLFSGTYGVKWCVLSPTYKGRFVASHEPGPHALDSNKHTVYTLNYTLEKFPG